MDSRVRPASRAGRRSRRERARPCRHRLVRCQHDVSSVRRRRRPRPGGRDDGGRLCRFSLEQKPMPRLINLTTSSASALEKLSPLWRARLTPTDRPDLSIRPVRARAPATGVQSSLFNSSNTLPLFRTCRPTAPVARRRGPFLLRPRRQQIAPQAPARSRMKHAC